MGTGSFVRERSAGSKNLASLMRGIDLPFLGVVLALIVYGLVMLYSASWDFSFSVYGNKFTMFYRQLLWLVLGVVAAISLSVINYHYWRTLVVPIMALVITSLVVVLAIGIVRFGATRNIFGGSGQPSELAKLVTILYLCVWLFSKRDQLHELSFGLLPMGVILGIIGGLIYLQPDLSAAATVLLLGGLLFFLAGGDLKQISVMLLIALLAAALVVSLSQTGQQRVGDFLAGIKDPLQASYHVRRSFEAIVNGGWFGVGLGKSLSKYTGLPVPPTDSIFSVVVEELGWVGGIILIMLFVAFVWRGFLIAHRAPDMLGTLIAAGLSLWIGIEALINIAVLVGLVPFAGNALPFISAGGSNLISSCAAVGILLNISRQRTEGVVVDHEWRSHSAVANLRWWDGWRGLSRARRTQRAGRSTTRR